MKLLSNFSLVVLRQKTDANKRLFGQQILGLTSEQWLVQSLQNSFAEIVMCADVAALKKKQAQLKSPNAVCLHWDTPLVRQGDIAGFCDSFLRLGKLVCLPRGFVFKTNQCIETNNIPFHAATSGAFLQLEDKTLTDIFLALRQEIISRHRVNGVKFWGVDGLHIENNVKIAAGAEIYAPNILQGNTAIGKRTVVLPNCQITDSKVGADCVIKSSVLTQASVDSGTIIGPYAQLRKDSIIGKDCKIGNFVEVKNSVIGDGSKAAHLAYIGDADIGKSVNIGCGVVFVNFDGKQKQRSLVSDNAFVGSNANIIAPVKIGEYGFVAAGTTVTQDVEAGELVIGRSRQVGKEGGGFCRLRKD